MLNRCKAQGKCLILDLPNKTGHLLRLLKLNPIPPSDPQSHALHQQQQQLLLNQGGFFGADTTKVIKDLLAAKSAANRRERYLKSLSYYLNQFAAAHPQKTAISDFTTADVETWMARYPGSWSRQTWLNRISTLFSFAVRRGHINVNPCERIERVQTDCNPPEVLTPDQVDVLLKIVSNRCRAYLVLAVFSGIRPEEIMRLNWKQINLETQTVAVEGKTRRRRIVHLEPRAAALLAGCVTKTGPVTPHLSTLRRFRMKVRQALGMAKFPQDLFRHTFASYALALYGDVGKVSTSMGNSSGVLLRHYHTPITQRDSALFWSLSGHTKYDPVGLPELESPTLSSTCGKIDRQDQPQNDADHQAPPSKQGQARTAIHQPDRFNGLRNPFGSAQTQQASDQAGATLDASPKPVTCVMFAGKIFFAGKPVTMPQSGNAGTCCGNTVTG